jgi:protein-L-isoaspartate O-methyltransferase
MEHTATYSPEDNKLRLSPAYRLSKEDYDRVKAAGFSWAPKQEIFVAGMWTPEREDLLIEMCGEIGDEDTSLVERAEQRAERFEEYSEKRAEDANRARAHVESIAGGIPFGQPILIGHHSERHARKDAEKIRAGMDRAVSMWKTSKYWQSRAAGAIRAAKYKERPDVRHRRIKTLEAELRKMTRSRDEAADRFAEWNKCAAIEDREKRMAQAIRLANVCGSFSMPRKEGDRPDFNQRPDVYGCLTNSYPTLYAPRTLEEVLEQTTGPRYPRTIAHYERWVEHYQNRITYERAMLDESGGLVAEQHDIQVGGRVLIGGEWLAVLKVNRAGGRVNSVTTNARYVSVRGIEEVQGYKAPSAEDAAKVKKVMALPPLCNYPGAEFLHMTKAEYEKNVPKWSDFSKIRVIQRGDEFGAHRVKCTRKPGGSFWDYVYVFLTDEKLKQPPKVEAPVSIAREFAPVEAAPEPQPVRVPETGSLFELMAETLKAGVQVVAAPQLFPTPPELARRVVELAEIEPGQCVLEPSAGTGNLCRAVIDSVDTEVLAYEINSALCSQLARTFPSYKVKAVCSDFLQVSDFMGAYPRIVMNPPFADSQDIAHVRHAYKFLAPGGRMVAIMGEGAFYRQDRAASGFRDWRGDRRHV